MLSKLLPAYVVALVLVVVVYGFCSAREFTRAAFAQACCCSMVQQWIVRLFGSWGGCTNCDSVPACRLVATIRALAPYA
jgi:hypothetical protein